MNATRGMVRFASVVFLLAIAGSANAYLPIIDLGTLGGSWSESLSINSSGQIIGTASTIEDVERAFLFDPTGSGNNIDLGTLGGSWSKSRSINSSGQIVGTASIIDDSGRACLFDQTGGGANIDLGTLGGSQSIANSINDNGQIVGAALNGDDYYHACLFDQTGNGNNIKLGTLGGAWSEAWSINNSGQIVGHAAGIDGYGHATLFDSTGGLANLRLGSFLSSRNSGAWSINNNSKIIGFAEIYSDEELAYIERAYLFDPNDGPDNIELGTLGGLYSRALFINDLDQIVGWATDSSGDTRATLFDSTGSGNNIDLNTFIDPSSGWTLFYAYGINDNGWIVGTGLDPEGFEHAFLLIPEPATLLLFGLGSLTILRKRRI